jgi:hypothetical protein
MLTVYVNKNQKDWDRHLGIVMGAYHSCPHATTGYSPNYMLYGRELPLPIDQVLKANEKYESIEDYFNILLKRTSFAQDLVKARIINRAVKLVGQDKDSPLQDADDGKSSDENSEDDNSSDKEGEFEVEEIRV